MIYRFFFLYLFLLGIFANAQTNRFYYQVKFKPDTVAAYELKEIFVLDVNPKSIKYYSLIDQKNDSIMKNSSSDSEYQKTSLYHYISRERNSFNNKNFLFAGDVTAQIDTKDDMKWNILAETKMLDKIKLQAATTNFGGRKWTAWFANTIPINEGPYKFRGLPGMIVEVYDSKDYYHFTLVKNEKLDKEYDTTGIVETHFGEKPLVINKQKYIKLKQNGYTNPFESMINDKLASYTDENGNEVFYDYRQMTIQKQKELKAINNPIEKDFMIDYK